jgi:hypothetical protein
MQKLQSCNQKYNQLMNIFNLDVQFQEKIRKSTNQNSKIKTLVVREEMDIKKYKTKILYIGRMEI